MSLTVRTRDGRDITFEDDAPLRRRRPSGADATSKQTPYAKKRARRELISRLAAFGGMFLFLVVFWTLIVILFARVAHGGDCDTLKEPDERHMCRAVTQCLKSECEFISSSDTRQVCRVRVKETCHR